MRRVQKTQVCPANCALHVLANVCPPQAEDIRSRCPHTFSHYSQFRRLCAASILTAVQGREGRSRTSDTVSSPSWPLQGCAYTCQVLSGRGSLPSQTESHCYIKTWTKRRRVKGWITFFFLTSSFLLSHFPFLLTFWKLYTVFMFYVSFTYFNQYTSSPYYLNMFGSKVWIPRDTVLSQTI